MVGNSLNSSCLKRMQHCVGTTRKASKSNRCWSRKLIKSKLPHQPGEAVDPSLPEISCSGPSRQNRSDQTHGERKRVNARRQTANKLHWVLIKSPETENLNSFILWRVSLPYPAGKSVKVFHRAFRIV